MDQNGAILDFLWHLKKENKAEGTIRSYRHSLNQLSTNGVNLFNPESFKETLALSSFSETHKYCLAKAYQSFLNYRKIDCKLPKYKCARRKDPYLPPPEHLAQLFNQLQPTNVLLLLYPKRHRCQTRGSAKNRMERHRLRKQKNSHQLPS